MNYADYYASSYGSDDSAIRCVGLRVKNDIIKKTQSVDNMDTLRGLARPYSQQYPLELLEGVEFQSLSGGSLLGTGPVVLSFDEK
jgi:hypothetical protein